ncbi:SRPBCC family protein [Halobacillus hunanensis]|uniref:SRPBCC family protein n=1 Tax=Halobacillus hunanensis TaxID=578214 RepID=UPI001C37B1AA|nr:SRPBCC family protein [Halobacillus hunanensis]
MKIYVKKVKQQLPISLEHAWSFFSNAGNLSDITPSWMKFEVTGELPDKMYQGMVATYRIQPLKGITLRWVTEITHMVEGKYFIDEQRFGPYRFWHHQHHFKEIESGVEMQISFTTLFPLPPLAVSHIKLMWKKNCMKFFSTDDKNLKNYLKGERGAHKREGWRYLTRVKNGKSSNPKDMEQ